MSDLGTMNDDWLKSRSWDLPTDTAVPWLLAIGVDHDTPEDEARRLVAVALELPSAAAMPASVRADLARRNLLLPESVAKHNPGGQSHDQNKHGRRRTHRSMEDYESGGLFGGPPQLFDLASSSVSPHEKVRVDTLHGADQAVLNELWGGTHGADGVVAQPIVLTRLPNGFKVEGYFLDPRNPDPTNSRSVIGQFYRAVRREDKEDGRGKETVVEHELLVLDDIWQGKGVGRSFYRSSEDAYRRNGVDAVEVSAGMRVGGYAWAREGFDFRPKNRLPDTVGEALRRESGLHVSDSGKPTGPWLKEDQRKLSAILGATRHGRPPPSPYTISELGRDGPRDRYGRHLGRAVLMGTDWAGRKELRQQ